MAISIGFRRHVYFSCIEFDLSGKGARTMN
jgi:hypothetical protein